MINQQTPEPPVKADGRKLDVHSIFFTVQGEGPFSGHRAVFLRLAGCNLKCPGCDTEYTQGREVRNALLVSDEVTRLAKNNGADRCLVVITGGEPLRQPIGYIVRDLLAKGHPVQIESNGTCAPDEILQTLLLHPKHNGAGLTLVVSPKTRHIHSKCHELASAFKYVLDHREVSEKDGLPKYALEHRRGNGVARPRKGAPVYLTPYDVGNESDGDNHRNRAAVTASCKVFGHIAGLQVHKYLGVA